MTCTGCGSEKVKAKGLCERCYYVSRKALVALQRKVRRQARKEEGGRIEDPRQMELPFEEVEGAEIPLPLS